MNNYNTEKIDPIYDYLGKILISVDSKGKFAGRLIAIIGNELWFEGKDGRRWMQNRNEIKTLRLGKQVD